MANVDTAMIESIGEQLKGISNSISDSLSEIEHNLKKTSSAISILEEYNGQDASEQWRVERESSNIIEKIIKNYDYYKNIWSINISKSSGEFSDYASSATLSQAESNADELSASGSEIVALSASLAGMIGSICNQLSCEYTGDIKSFFNGLKDNETWKEMKIVSEEAMNKKKNDEAYRLYRSSTGEADLVDTALDELGNRYIAANDSTKYATWYLNNNPGSGASKSDNWCAEFVSYAAAQAGISTGAIKPYLSVSTGAREAQERAAAGNGQWHDSSDTSYTPKRGDIYYTYKGNASHTAIVVSSNGNQIVTIEGNTAADNGNYALSNSGNNMGGYVNTRVRDTTYVQGGYYTPDAYVNSDGAAKSSSTTLSSDALAIKNATVGNTTVTSSESE